MNPLQIVNILQMVIPMLLGAYKDISNDLKGQVPPLEDILAGADAQYQSVVARAKQEIADAEALKQSKAKDVV